MNGSDEIELRWIFRVLSRWLWLIIGCVILAAALAYVVTARIKPVYKATATLYIESARDTKTSEYNVLMAGERLAQTYSQMVKEPPVLAAVIGELGLTQTPGQLADMITADPVPNTQLMRLAVQGPDPQQAALIANALAETLVSQVRSLQIDRFTNSLTSAQQSLDELSTRVEETQAKIDELRTKKFEGEAELTRQQSLLTEYGNKYRTIQQSYQDLLLTINQQRNKINIIEASHVPNDQVRPPYTAVVTFLLQDEPLALTYGEILTGRPVLEAAIQKLSLQTSPEELRKSISANPILNTQLIQLNVMNNDLGQATRLAEAIANAFLVKVQMLLSEPYTVQADDLLDQMNEISTQMQQTQAEIETLTGQNIQADSELARLENMFDEDRSDLQARQTDYEQLQFTVVQAADAILLSSKASAPQHPTQNRMLYITLAAMVGLAVGGSAAFLLEYLDDTVNTSDDVTKKLGLSIIGVIDVISKADRGILVSDQPRSPSAEDFRALATNIRYASLDKPMRTLLVTSPLPSDGKTLVAANLASAIAQGENSVVIVDADLRLPKVHQRFEVEQSQGLTESLLQNSIDGNLQPSRLERLNILTSGKLPPNPGEVVASDRMRHLITELSQKADKVVLDSPPILVTADAKTLATEVDGVLLVVRAGQTTYQAVREAVESLQQVNAHLIGVVLNGARQRKRGYYSYHYQESRRKTKRFSRKGWLEKFEKKLSRGQPESREPDRIPQEERVSKAEINPSQSQPVSRKPGGIPWIKRFRNNKMSAGRERPGIRELGSILRKEWVEKIKIKSRIDQPESGKPDRVPQEEEVVKAEIIPSQPQPEIGEPGPIPQEEGMDKAEIVLSQQQPEIVEPGPIAQIEDVAKVGIIPGQPHPDGRKPGRVSRKKGKIKAEIIPSPPQPESGETGPILQEAEAVKVEIAPNPSQTEKRKSGRISQKGEAVKAEPSHNQPQPEIGEPGPIPPEEEVVKAEITPNQPQPDSRKSGRISRRNGGEQNRQRARPAKTNEPKTR